MKKNDEQSPEEELLTAAQVEQRFGIAAATLLRWVKLRRVHPVRVKLSAGLLARLGRGQTVSDLRFTAGDIAAAVEASLYAEPGSRRDPSMG